MTDVPAPDDIDQGPNPHDIPDNGTGGLSGTHDGHADSVSAGYGLGFASALDQTQGNHAARLARGESIGDNGRDVWPIASGNFIDPGAN